jgi:hypothetical protein
VNAVDFHDPQVVWSVHHQLDVFRNRAAQKKMRGFDRCPDVNGRRSRRVATRERQQLRCQRTRSRVGTIDSIL